MHKVIWLVRGDDGYGVKRATLSMADEFRRRGIESVFFAIENGSLCEELVAKKYSVLIKKPTSRVKTKHATASLSNSLRMAASAFRSSLEVTGWDAIKDVKWIHVRINALLPLACLLAIKRRWKIYWHLPNTINDHFPLRLQPLAMQLLCRFFSINALGNSKHTAESLGSNFIQPRVLYLGVDPNQFTPNSSNDGADMEGRIKLGIFARVNAEKAQARVVQAVIDLARTGVDIELIIAGGPIDGEYVDKIKNLVRNQKAENFIHLLGPLADVRPHIQAVDIVINSRNGPEPFGFSIIESMLLKRPVLAYAEGGPRETIIDNETGWLIDGCEISDYRSGIEHAITQRHRWREMGSSAREHALKNFSIEKSVASYLRILRDDNILPHDNRQ